MTRLPRQLTTIKGANPEWLGVYAANPEGSKIVNQMDELELLSTIHISVVMASSRTPRIGTVQRQNSRGHQLGRGF